MNDGGDWIISRNAYNSEEKNNDGANENPRPFIYARFLFVFRFHHFTAIESPNNSANNEEIRIEIDSAVLRIEIAVYICKPSTECGDWCEENRTGNMKNCGRLLLVF